MGKIEKEKRRFKSPFDYRRNFFYHVFFIAICIVGEYAAFSWSEEEMVAYINEKSGNSEIGLGKLVIRIMMMVFGNRTGFVIGVSIFVVVILYAFYEEIAAYCRYKKKCKLYQEGHIKNFYDIYDDQEPLWRRIKLLFAKKEKNTQKKYPSNREMKRQIKEQENLRRNR
jgi:hypothetical protein